ncbi:hypothetical protein ATE92_2475 [Ulvibacter sp. MAR_2010_11]|uniref:hypothetical protein n=1 Tax=Ulvibacter sp. MAR_2010_11 TaxID=1250229 RepID=UPI000C2BF528|nr:hypothetical protein [Ulvibacter sp. MAR_2010_11]PKA84294.1 hypothetical protein ATE92_2475 [Ulvibacter sp. MAR_2010_11]
MKSQFKKAVFLLLIPAIVFANPDKFKGKYTKEKTLKKEYSVNANAGLKVDNSYGNIYITTWNENRTVIEVHITTNGDDEKEVQERLDQITVDFTGNASLVTAKTRFGDNNNNSWSWWGKKHKSISIEVNYTIKIPAMNSVDLNNDYGSINLNRLEGNAKINCDYGQLIIGELLADNNYLNFDYTSNSTIAYMKSGKIDADYSGFVLDKVGRLELNADYTNSEIGEATEVNYNNDYGKVTINKAGNITGRGDYVSNRIGTVTGTLNLNTDYGSITVDRLTGSAKDVTINADYTGIKLGFASNYNFNFTVNLTYCSLKGVEEISVTNTSKESSHKMYSGYHGSKNSGNTVNIRSDYGGVTFIKN